MQLAVPNTDHLAHNRTAILRNAKTIAIAIHKQPLTIGYVSVAQVHYTEAHPGADAPRVLHSVKYSVHLLPDARALLKALVALARVH